MHAISRWARFAPVSVMPDLRSLPCSPGGSALWRQGRAGHRSRATSRASVASNSVAFGSSASQQDRQLQIRNNTEAWLRDGRFDEDRMLAAFEEMAASARSADGFGACMTTSSFAPIIWNSFAGMPCSTSCGRTRWSLLEGISNKTLIHAPRGVSPGISGTAVWKNKSPVTADQYGPSTKGLSV
jgi:hypothetical protein